MRTAFEVTLDRAPSELYPYLADPANRPEWQSSIEELEMRTAGPPGVGTRWRERAKGFGTFDMEIAEYEAPTLWSERGTSTRGSMFLRLRFAEAPARKTRLTVEVELDLQGVFRWLQWFAPPVLKPLMRADLHRAARLSGPSGPP